MRAKSNPIGISLTVPRENLETVRDTLMAILASPNAEAVKLAAINCLRDSSSVAGNTISHCSVQMS